MPNVRHARHIVECFNLASEGVQLVVYFCINSDDIRDLKQGRERHKTTGLNSKKPCTCVLHFDTFLCRSRLDNDVK